MMQGTPQMRALIDAGRELAGHRPLAELFPLIMDLSTKAVRAGRGVLMTLEGDQLNVRAAHGAGFQISSTVRDRVLKEKDSLLVRDAQLDQALREHMSIVEQKVRSMIAVPLQTNDRVIGLIYVDSPHAIREFTRRGPEPADRDGQRRGHPDRARAAERNRGSRARHGQGDAAGRADPATAAWPATRRRWPGYRRKTVACRTVGGDYYDFIKFPDGRVGHAWWAMWPGKACPQRC